MKFKFTNLQLIYVSYGNSICIRMFLEATWGYHIALNNLLYVLYAVRAHVYFVAFCVWCVSHLFVNSTMKWVMWQYSRHETPICRKMYFHFTFHLHYFKFGDRIDLKLNHDDVIKWRHFPRYWPFERGIHLSPQKGPVTRSFHFLSAPE